MADYQIDLSQYDGGRKPLRIGHGGEVATFQRKGRLIANMVGTVGSDSYEMKLPAPWTSFLYRLEQDKRLLASAPKPKVRGGVVSFDLDLVDRKLTLVARDRRGLSWALDEGGSECGSFDRREFGDQQEWSADLRAPRDWSVALTAFVAWLVCEAPEGNLTAP